MVDRRETSGLIQFPYWIASHTYVTAAPHFFTIK